MANTLRDHLQDVREEYLVITENAQIDNSVSDITYTSREPTPESSRFNVGDNIRMLEFRHLTGCYHLRLIYTWKAYYFNQMEHLILKIGRANIQT